MKLMIFICVNPSQVVVKSLPNTAAVDLESVLFLEKGGRALGRVFDVFGPVTRPYYAVRCVVDLWYKVA